MNKIPFKLRHLMLAFALTSMSAAYAVNPVKNVTQVASAVTLDEAVDYQITGTDPFAVAGSIDIANADAAVIFANIRPSVVIAKYLDKVTVNGVALKNNVNCRVSIYKQGAIVLPHSDTKNPDGTDFYPLTTFEGDNCEGESTQYNGDARRTSNASFKMRSFKLKRGYMVTMANNVDGTGYSHCYIANSEDITVQLRKELADKVGFFRIFRWQWPAKKGTCDRSATGLNATWHYDWGAGRYSETDYEYVPQRHHEAGQSNSNGYKDAWESWTNINAADGTCTHVLGQNEPDNVSGAGEVYTYVTEIPDNPREKHGDYPLVNVAKDFLYSGKRIGTFACCNPNREWVSEYVNWCRANNIRVDFVATHYYIGGQSPQGCIDRLEDLYNATGLPVWVTEWNNGANWSGESGFSTDAGWYAWGSGNDSEKNGEWLTDVLKRADKPENRWLERLAVYSAVEEKREVMMNDVLTEAGKMYAAYNSTFAYDEANEYFMTWNHKAPTDLDLEFKATTKRATLKWNHNNSKQTDSIFVERKIAGVDTDFVAIAKKNTMQTMLQTYTDTLVGKAGLVTYRIKNYDSDGKTRTSGEVAVTLGSAMGNDVLQYGRLSISNLDEISTDFTTTYAENPAVFMGLVTNNNATAYPCNLVTSVAKAKFGYKMLPWLHSGDQTMAKVEDVNFMAMPYGNYTYGNMDVEVGAAKVKGDTLEVVFNKPFPEGVTPVVITELKPTLKTAPIMTKVWDVTNTGFKTTIMYEAGEGKSIRAAQNMSYMAVTPGQAYMGDGVMISAGIGENPAYGATYKMETFTREVYDAEGDSMRLDTLKLENPYIFGSLQTYNVGAGTLLRNQRNITVTEDDVEYVTGLRLKRIVDKSAPSSVRDTKDSADKFGWIALSTGENGGEDVGIEDVVVAKSENPLVVEVINRCIYVEDVEDFDVYTVNGTKVAANATQEPGVYVVRAGKKTAKVIVR